MEVAGQDFKPIVTDSRAVVTPVRRLGLNSGVYVVGNLVTRGVNFLLVPVFTRVLTTDDYGILAITTTVAGLLGMVLGLALDSAITQMYFRYRSSDEHRSLYGTLLSFWVIVPGLAALSLDFLGQADLLNFFPSVPFHPYLRMTIWTSYLSIFVNLPRTIYMTLQQPLRVVGLDVMYSLATICFSIYLVVYLRQGVTGSLLATLTSSGIMAVVAIFLTLRMAPWRLSVSKLKSALIFSLPLVPHLVCHWILNLSDRFILERYVSTGELGLYSVGYQFGLLVSIFATGINNAFFPIANAQLSQESLRGKVPVLGTYMLLGTTYVGLSVGMLGGDVIRLLTPPAFHEAAAVIPWFAVAYVFQGEYFIWSRSTWFSMRTGWVPIVTALAAGINVGLNLWLVPRWGIVAAAFNTAVAFGVLALLHGYLAHKVYPIAWEYDRWTKLLALGGIWLIVGNWLSGDHLFLNLVLKTAIMVVLFPLSLRVVRFFRPREWDFIYSLPGRLGPSLKASLRKK